MQRALLASCSSLDGGSRVWLEDWLAEYHVCTLGVRTQVHRQLVDIAVAKFKSSVVGMRIWWSFESLWKLLGFRFPGRTKKISSSMFFQHRWKALHNWLLQLDLGPPTLRKAIPFSVPFIVPDRTRVLPFHSLSTAGVIAVLGRFAFGGRTVQMKDDLNRNAAEASLEAILWRFNGIDKCVLVVYMDSSMLLQPPGPAQGDPLTDVQLTMEKGRITKIDYVDGFVVKLKKADSYWLLMLKESVHDMLGRIGDTFPFVAAAMCVSSDRPAQAGCICFGLHLGQGGRPRMGSASP